MTIYDFDRVIDRRGTDSIKIDNVKAMFGKEDLLPMWVADMDFETPPCIIEAAMEKIKQPVWGYTKPSNSYWKSIQQWLKRKHALDVNPDELGFVGGIVPGLSFAVNALTEKNDGIIIQPPVYPPFHSVVRHSKRELLFNPLIEDNQQFSMNFAHLPTLLENKPKMLILCNPHNPGGKVWSKEELISLADFCFDNDILVISDEIHADLTLPGYKHTPFASVSEKARMNSITFMAPSKTFNMAGVASSFYYIPNPTIRKKFQDFVLGNDLTGGHLFAYATTQAAFEKGEEWLLQVLVYINENIKFVETYLKKYLPKIKMMRPEASFLIWLDFSETGLSHDQVVEKLKSEAGLALNDGISFGKEGTMHMRLNIGTSRSIVEEALRRMKAAFV